MLLPAALLLAAAPPGMGPTVTSAAPQAVAVTVYRDPFRRGGPGAMNLRWLNGFALVTETRTVRLPAGAATLRFEGVAGGIVPASAIVIGLPGGVVEKNRDARLLSPAALVDGFLGRRVTLTRTDPHSGKALSEPAEIVAGPAGGVVVRTPEGMEALGCSGLAEHLSYPGVPAGLSAQPVLSVETASPAPATATVTLSYLTSAFDWSASYVATVRPDGRHLDLFAWLTLANGNRESFPAAQVQAVAGRLNHQETADEASTQPLELRCYPLGSTKDASSGLAPPAVVSPAPLFARANEIVVTGARMAKVEDLGDLKLFTVPERVTVAPNAQKQVALLARDDVPFTRIHSALVGPGDTFPARPTTVVLRLRNVNEAGLGLALPAGTTALYARRGGDRLLVGTGSLPDKAVGETLRLTAGTSTQVQVSQADGPGEGTRLQVSNANPFPVSVEIAIEEAPGNIVPNRAITIVESRPTWVVTVPAGAVRSLDYRVKP